jgi:serine/threonine protein kinase/Leucine-rich repeat (LRR) protein
MSDDRYRRAEAIFLDALESAPDERDAVVRAACGGDKALRTQVDELLAAHAQADGSFMTSVPTVVPTLAAQFATMRADEMGDRIGPYKLLQQLGEGGFGVVWMAEQIEPVRRKVALKIIKLGMDTKNVIARFEQERQALAMMDHPNIAHVLDAGATSTGRPFFVMELVRGTRITEFCDAGQLPTEERLRLFCNVCMAVQHAHQKGIIHRDLKPSNILVTLHDGVAVPKVIDFGVAKAIQQQRLTDLTLFTHFEQMIGTPLYMSPEQAEMSGLDIDTRSDIYSLGVLLYELLTGRTPFDPAELMRRGLDEIRRAIREQEPLKPSTAVSTLAREALRSVASNRASEPPRLVYRLRGDLDWIVMKALEKDRTRRYETATGLAADIQRHLRNEPVLASPPSELYRFRRMVRRNKPAFAAVTAVVLALVVGLALAVWQARLVKREADRANAALADLRGTAPTFLAEANLLAGREQFPEAIAKLDYAIKLQPEVAEYLVRKADLLQCQARLAEALTIYRSALALDPTHARAETNATLCAQLLQAPASRDRSLSHESLSQLFLALQKEQRAAAELMPIARLLGEQSKLLVAHWSARLQELPIPPERPLKERLSLREDGLLALDLSGTKIADLTPLGGMPLGELDCSRCAEIVDLKPLAGMPLKALDLAGTGVTDIAPLSSLSGLKRLNLHDVRVSDLTPLSGLPLEWLDIASTQVVDLAPLRAVPIQFLHVGWTKVADLTPLASMPLKSVDVSALPALDFSPLQGLPLEECQLQNTRVRDLGFLRGLPLKRLYLNGCHEARNLAVLAEIPTLELLMLPERFREFPQAELDGIATLRSHPKLRQIGSDFMAGMAYDTVEAKELFWQEWDREAVFLRPLREAGIRVVMQKLPDGRWDLQLDNQPVSDIRSLKGAPLQRLNLLNTKVSDLTPLEGIPLQILAIQNTNVSDIRALAGMPLTELYMDGCAAEIDLTPLAGASKLERLMLPPRPQNLDKLRELPKLRYIAYEYDYRASRPAHTAAEFWALKDLPSERELVEARDYAGLEAFLRKRISGATERPDSLDWLKLGLAVLAQNEAPRYAAVCREMLAQFGTDASPPDAERCVKLCLATPRSEIEPQVLAPFVEAQRPLANDPASRRGGSSPAGCTLFVLATTQLRSTRWAALQVTRTPLPWRLLCGR